jgi:SAM-dependent methyltransferase
MTEQRDRRVVFGEAVEEYDAQRPGYPEDLVSDVLAYAGVTGPGRPVLELGAGTGKATLAFAGRGLDVTCLEADPRMAAVLTRNCAGLPRVRVEVTEFEQWRPPHGFALLYCAQAWHWMDPRRRWDLAHAALAPGGAIALFWNGNAVADPELHAALAAVDERYAVEPGRTPHAHLAAGVCGDLPGDVGQDDDWPARDLAGDPRFTCITDRRYRGRTRHYTTAGYLDLLATMSVYRMMDGALRDRVLTAVARVLDGHGGAIDVVTATDLFLARRAPR